jgi:hypothetical protein
MRVQHRLGSASCILPHSLTHVGTQIRQVNLFALPPSLPCVVASDKTYQFGLRSVSKIRLFFWPWETDERDLDLNLTRPNTACLFFTYVATFGSLYLPLPSTSPLN